MATSQPPLALPLRSTPFHTTSPPGNASLAASPSAVFATLTPEETASRLQTNLHYGLNSSREAMDRREIHGSNEISKAEDEPLYMRFMKQFMEPLILLLLGSAVVSLLMRNYDDALSIALAVLIVVTVGFVQEYRSEKSLEALNKLVPNYAHLIRGKQAAAEVASGRRPHSTTVLAGQLVPGDLITFTTGDRIPADVRITVATELEIDESNLTGENEPVQKKVEAVNRENVGAAMGDIPVSERSCIAFMGTLVRHGNGQGIVIATGSKTEFGTISEMLSGIETPRTPLQTSMDNLGKELSYASFAVIGVIVLVGIWQGREWLDMFQIGVSLAVAAIPEGLPIIVTVTLALGVLRMVKRGGIVRKLPSVETLGCVSVVCSDKTGTLTMNHMTVTHIWTCDMGTPEDKSTFMGSHPNAAVRALVKVGNLCNNARVSASNASSAAAAVGITGSSSSATSRFVGQPTDVALLDLVDAFRLEDARNHFHRVSESAFSSHRKWMGIVASNDQTPDGHLTAYIKGATDTVISKCANYLTADGGEVSLDEHRRQSILSAAEKMAETGLRVIAFASSSTSAPVTPNSDSTYQNMTFVGIVGIMDPPRPEVAQSIRRLMRGGVKVMMITGDAETTATAIARQLGMPLNPRGRAVLRGEDLDAMSDAQLTEAIANTTIFARTSPEHKMKIVRALQARHEVVAMTGDGVNDAPALKMADIGVAMGKNGTDVAKEAADMVLSDDNFSTILGAIEEGKGIFYNIQNFLTFQLSTSVAALTLVLVSTLFGLKNPLNPMQILWINILMDGPPAQSLGVEPVSPHIMSLPPRPRHARILTPRVLRRILISSILIFAGTFFTYLHEMSDGKVTARDTTMTFTCFVFFDMFNALACRSDTKSYLLGEMSWVGNKMFNWSVMGSIIGQMLVVYWGPLQRVFMTEALSKGDLLWLLVLGSCVWWVDEARKMLRRKREGWRGGYSTSV
ncbi:calcium-transporting P [Ascodesmis nigricans]|uniref:Calcium-transporting ATPase n=1 Tax=Ascodesmis nigricans TaxID=341454 RepID=A0A4S2N2K5_9PEZI|nr:calcium-transporting P [Ascodesmis nigricans]